MVSFESDIKTELLIDEGDKKTFGGEINRNWFIVNGPNGGFIAALMLRALKTAVSDSSRLARMMTIDYFAPPKTTEYNIKTEIVRRGRSLTFIRATMWQGDVLNASASAAFATDYKTKIELPSEKAPNVVPYDDCAKMEGILPIHNNYEMRPAFGALPFSSGDKAVSGGWTKFIEPPEKFNAEMLAAISDCWPPALFSIMQLEQFGKSHGMPTVELSIYFIQPAIYQNLEPTKPVLARFQCLETIEGFFTEDGDIWSENGDLLVRCRQIAIAL